MPQSAIPLLIVLLSTASCAQSQQQLPNSPDAFPATRGLPDLFNFEDGTPVAGIGDWERRREELKEPLLYYQYGHMPPRPDQATARLERNAVAVGFRKDSPKGYEEFGLGTMNWLTLIIGSEKKLEMRAVLYHPGTEGPHPVIIEEEGNIGGSKNAQIFIGNKYIFIEYARGDLDPGRQGMPGPAQRAYPEHDWPMLAAWAWGGRLTGAQIHLAKCCQRAGSTLWFPQDPCKRTQVREGRWEGGLTVFRNDDGGRVW